MKPATIASIVRPGLPILTRMEPLNAYRLAVHKLGNVAADRLAAFIVRTFGLRIDARFFPLYRATLRDQEGLKPARPAPASEPLEISAGPRRFQEVKQQAQALLARHGLTDWKFAYNRRKQAMGLCVYHRKTIELSIHFVERNDAAEILDTLLHEIAHALTGPGHGHDAAWKRKCLEVGARPQRCGQANMPTGKWQAQCKGCGKGYSRHRKPKSLRGWHCRTCGPKKGSLVWGVVDDDETQGE